MAFHCSVSLSSSLMTSTSISVPQNRKRLDPTALVTRSSSMKWVPWIAVVRIRKTINVQKKILYNIKNCYTTSSQARGAVTIIFPTRRLHLHLRLWASLPNPLITHFPVHSSLKLVVIISPEDSESESRVPNPISWMGANLIWPPLVLLIVVSELWICSRICRIARLANMECRNRTNLGYAYAPTNKGEENQQKSPELYA